MSNRVEHGLMRQTNDIVKKYPFYAHYITASHSSSKVEKGEEERITASASQKQEIYDNAKRIVGKVYSRPTLNELTRPEQAHIKYLFHEGGVENDTIQKINRFMHDSGQSSPATSDKTQAASGKVLQHTKKLLLFLRYAVEQLYNLDEGKKYDLRRTEEKSQDQKISDACQKKIEQLYEEEYAKLDKSNTLDYLVFCMKNKHVYAHIQENLLSNTSIQSEKFFEEYLEEKNGQALTDLRHFLQTKSESDSKNLLPWVYGSGAIADDLPPHLEWSCITEVHSSECLDIGTTLKTSTNPLRAIGDPSDVFYRVCKPFEPKMLVAGKDSFAVSAEQEGGVVKEYVEYLTKGYQQFLVVAKEIPEGDRAKVLEMAARTQLKEAEELQKEFQTLLPYFDQGRAFLTYEQYQKMKALCTHTEFTHLKEFFTFTMPEMTANEFAAEISKNSDGGQNEGGFLSYVWSGVEKLRSLIKVTTQFLLSSFKTIASTLKNSWTYLASTRAGQWAMAAVGDPVKAAQRVRWVGGILRFACIGFGQFLGAPRETLIAEGGHKEMKALYDMKVIEAENDVAPLRQQTYNWLWDKLKTKKDKEVSRSGKQEWGFEDDRHYETLRKKVCRDVPVRRLYNLKEDKGYFYVTEKWSWLGIMGSWAQDVSGGMIKIDWTLYEKDLDDRKWWGGILSYMKIFSHTVKQGWNTFVRAVTHTSATQALKGITAYFKDPNNLKTIAQSAEGLLDAGLAMAPLGGPVGMVAAAGAKFLLRRGVEQVAETVVEECKYAMALNDYWLLWGELCALFDMELIVQNLFAGSTDGFVSFNCLNFTSLLLYISRNLSQGVAKIKKVVTPK